MGPGRRSTEKASLGYLKPLGSYAKKYLPALITVIIFSIAGTIFSILGPRFLSRITDLISVGLTGQPIDMDAVIERAITMLCFYLAALLLQFFQAFIMATITQNTAYDLRRDLTRKINILPLRYFDNTMIGDILSRMTNDVDTISRTMSQSISSMFSQGTQFLGSLLLMFITDWRLTLVAIAAAFIGFFIMIAIMSRSQKYFVAQQSELGALNGHVEEMYNGHDVVKAYNAEARENKKFEDVNGRLAQATWKSQFFAGIMMPIMGFIANLGYVAVCIVGAVMAMNGQITFGVIVAFMIYIRLFTNPMQQLGSVFTQLQSTAAASKRVFDFLDEEEMPDDSDVPLRLQPDEIKGNIDFEHVKFGYRPEKTIIHDFNAHVKAGTKVAIVGPTGAGKTTMVNLLMRFYETDEGNIIIDGVNLKDMSRHEIHDLFGMVLQDTWLFEGSFKENIRYGKDVPDEAVIEAAKAAGIDHFIRTTPHGYDTILNENANVSQGQKQLITIARAMVENAPFLILDEATSSVDTRTEELIQKAMDELMKGRTSFIIAHRLSTIRDADTILVIKNGDIIEQGNHEELLAKGGFYAELYNSQFDS